MKTLTFSANSNNCDVVEIDSVKFTVTQELIDFIEKSYKILTELDAWEMSKFFGVEFCHEEEVEYCFRDSKVVVVNMAGLLEPFIRFKCFNRYDDEIQACSDRIELSWLKEQLGAES